MVTYPRPPSYRVVLLTPRPHDTASADEVATVLLSRGFEPVHLYPQHLAAQLGQAHWRATTAIAVVAGAGLLVDATEQHSAWHRAVLAVVADRSVPVLRCRLAQVPRRVGRPADLARARTSRHQFNAVAV